MLNWRQGFTQSPAIVQGCANLLHLGLIVAERMQNGNVISKDEVITKLKDDGDFDCLRLKIIRRLKDNVLSVCLSSINFLLATIVLSVSASIEFSNLAINFE